MMDYGSILRDLRCGGNLRSLPQAEHEGACISVGGRRMLNLSSNDYLGLASDSALRDAFLDSLRREDFVFSSSSSRLLTGNFPVYDRVEALLASLYGAGAALVLSSGYLMNSGILPCVTDSSTLVLADKLVHASIIDGLRLSGARVVRYRHQDLGQLERLVEENRAAARIIVVTESIFSMDGDVADLREYVRIKRKAGNVMLYVDEAHAVGVRGDGLGVAAEQGCVQEIDFLCGTFGKALASVGAFVVCPVQMKEFLVNRMRTLIFNTALPPLNMLWTEFVLRRLEDFAGRRERLKVVSGLLGGLVGVEGASHIVPVMVGDSLRAVELSAKICQSGFYLLPVRPPTVPEGTARLRVSLTSEVGEDDVRRLAGVIRDCMCQE